MVRQCRAQLTTPIRLHLPCGSVQKKKRDSKKKKKDSKKKKKKNAAKATVGAGDSIVLEEEIDPGTYVCVGVQGPVCAKRACLCAVPCRTRLVRHPLLHGCRL